MFLWQTVTTTGCCQELVDITLFQPIGSCLTIDEIQNMTDT